MLVQSRRKERGGGFKGHLDRVSGSEWSEGQLPARLVQTGMRAESMGQTQRTPFPTRLIALYTTTLSSGGVINNVKDEAALALNRAPT